MIVYKVVRKHNNKFYSAIIRRKHGGLAYQLNTTTVPEIPGSPIMAFDSVDAAQKFINKELGWNKFYRMPNYYILKCRAKVTKENYFHICRFEDLIKSFWTKNSEAAYTQFLPFGLKQPPDGTIFCSRLTPYKLLG